MSANTYHERTWESLPSVTGGHRVQAIEEGSYFPESFDDCVQYLTHSGPADIAAYYGMPVHEELVQDLALKLYDPEGGVDILDAIRKYSDLQDSPEMAQHYEQRRTVALFLATRLIEDREYIDHDLNNQPDVIPTYYVAGARLPDGSYRTVGSITLQSAVNC